MVSALSVPSRWVSKTEGRLDTVSKRKPRQSDTQALSGLRRDRHFAEGGSVHEWRGGLAHRFVDRKREDNRRACRKFTIDD